MKEITILVSKDGGKVTVDANGFTGGSCQDFMKPIIEALGTVEQERKKPEFFQHEVVGIRAGGGM